MSQSHPYALNSLRQVPQAAVGLHIATALLAFNKYFLIPPKTFLSSCQSAFYQKDLGTSFVYFQYKLDLLLFLKENGYASPCCIFGIFFHSFIILALSIPS